MRQWDFPAHKWRFLALLVNRILRQATKELSAVLNAELQCWVETVQDFLIKLDIKPLMHLLEISIFSLNIDIVRLTIIMKIIVKDLKILSFKVISVSKIDF